MANLIAWLAPYLDFAPYNAYVWPAYGAVFAALVGLAWWTRRTMTSVQQQIGMLEDGDD